MTHSLASFMKQQQYSIQQRLVQYMDQVEAPPLLMESMKYSLLAGGKRIRPVFLLATIDALGHDIDKGYPAACAIEMIHTYSLIHDDLPAMDDDDYRRGQLTNHKKFGEAMAILAGDALLTHAFHVIAADSNTEPAQLLKIVMELSLYAGPRGMVGGQAADILGEEKQLDFDELNYIHEHKTADLLTCSVRLGAIIGQAKAEQLAHLTHFARHIGLAFQIQDDILDEIGDEAKIGKKVGSDRENNKTTYISLFGLEKSRAFLAEHIQEAKKALERADIQSELLIQLTKYMTSREV